MLQHLEARFLFVYCCLIRAILLMLAFTLTRTTTCTRNTCVVDLELSKSRVENDAHFSFSVFAIFAVQQKRRKQQAIFVQKEEYTADGNINVSQLRLSFFFKTLMSVDWFAVQMSPQLLHRIIHGLISMMNVEF